MKNIIIALFLLVFLASASQQQISSPGTHPRNYVEITDAKPYTVPVGKILVITALGRSVGSPSVGVASFTINGVQKGDMYMSLNLPHNPSVQPWTPGLAAGAGDIVETPTTNGVVYGYLSNE